MNRASLATAIILTALVACGSDGGGASSGMTVGSSSAAKGSAKPKSSGALAAPELANKLASAAKMANILESASSAAADLFTNKPSATTPEKPVKAIIPFYVYPGPDCDDDAWKKLLARPLIEHAYVILNPKSGPDADPDTLARFKACSRRLLSARGRTLGYVRTKKTVEVKDANGKVVGHAQFGLRDLQDIKNDIDQWKSFGVSGLFLDETTGVGWQSFPPDCPHEPQVKCAAGKLENDATHFAHYQEIAKYARAANADWKIWLNPGQGVLPAYLTGADKDRIGDGAIIAERALASWAEKCAPHPNWPAEGPWCSFPVPASDHRIDLLMAKMQSGEIPPERLGALIHGIPADKAAP